MNQPVGHDVGTVDGFVLHELVGVGTTSWVFKARDTLGDRDVAVKVLKDRSKDRAEFAQEYAAMASLGSDHIVTTYQPTATSRGYLAIVMEYLPQPLEVGGAPELAAGRFTEVGHAIGSALMTAQEKGLLHLDVKPTNIRLASDGRIKLIDFGASSTAVESLLRSCTPAFAAPEVLSPHENQKRQEQVSHSADVWSLGVTLLTVLTGDRPFGASEAPGFLRRVQGETPANVSAAISRLLPAGLESFVRDRMLAKEPSNRPAAAEVLERFTHAKEANIFGTAAGSHRDAGPVRAGDEPDLPEDLAVHDDPDRAIKVRGWMVAVAAVAAIALFFAIAALPGDDGDSRAAPTPVPELPAVGDVTLQRLSPVTAADISLIRLDGAVRIEFNSSNPTGTRYEFRVDGRAPTEPIVSSGEAAVIPHVGDGEAPCITVTVVGPEGQPVLPKTAGGCVDRADAGQLLVEAVPERCDRGACTVRVRLTNALPGSPVAVRVLDPSGLDPNEIFGNAYEAQAMSSVEGQIEWEFRPGADAPAGMYRVEVEVVDTGKVAQDFFDVS